MCLTIHEPSRERLWIHQLQNTQSKLRIFGDSHPFLTEHNWKCEEGEETARYLPHVAVKFMYKTYIFLYTDFCAFYSVGLDSYISWSRDGEKCFYRKIPALQLAMKGKWGLREYEKGGIW